VILGGAAGFGSDEPHAQQPRTIATAARVIRIQPMLVARGTIARVPEGTVVRRGNLPVSPDPFPMSASRTSATRWASFDCYGTLIDWNGGIRGELARVFGQERAGELLERYHELEPELEADGKRSYREVLTEAMRRLGAPPAEKDALARSLPEWQPFPEVREALREARERGWKLAILSNTDRDFIDASMRQLGVPFELAIVASEIGSYKPALVHWSTFERETGRLPDVHVAASLFHDIAPANKLGLKSIWINRLEEPASPEPTRELADLAFLPNTLDEVAA
jgi:2-haloacid dehalogenase